MEDDSSGYATVLMPVNSCQLSKRASHFVTIFSGSEMMLFRVEVTSDKLEGCLKNGKVLESFPIGKMSRLGRLPSPGKLYRLYRTYYAKLLTKIVETYTMQALNAITSQMEALNPQSPYVIRILRTSRVKLA